METSEVIKKLRIEKGFTQEELGKLVGVNKSTINKYENGTIKNFKNETLEIFSKIFNVPVSHILNLKTEEEIINYIPSLLEKFILFNYSPPYAERLTAEDRIKAYKMASEQIKENQDYFTGKYLETLKINSDEVYTVEDKVKILADDVIKKVFYDIDFSNRGAINKVDHELTLLGSELSSYFYYYNKDKKKTLLRDSADSELYNDLKRIIIEALNKVELIKKYYKE